MPVADRSQSDPKTAVQLCANVPLRLKAKSLLKPEQGPGEFLGLLIEEEQFVDALRFMPFAMELRDAVWWACLCAEHAIGEGVDPEAVDMAALVAAVDWVVAPSASHQKQARLAASRAGMTTAAGCAASAAACAGYALAMDKPIIPAQPVFACKSAACAALVGAPEIKSHSLSTNYLQFIQIGIAISHQTIARFSESERWPEMAAAR